LIDNRLNQLRDQLSSLLCHEQSTNYKTTTLHFSFTIQIFNCLIAELLIGYTCGSQNYNTFQLSYDDWLSVLIEQLTGPISKVLYKICNINLSIQTMLIFEIAVIED
jgi:hypothetical protein